jgi:hypothetical protein
MFVKGVHILRAAFTTQLAVIKIIDDINIVYQLTTITAWMA